MKIRFSLWCAAALIVLAAMLTKDAARAQTTEESDSAPAPAPKEAAATDCNKIGFVNLAKVLEESDKGKGMRQKLEGEREKAFLGLKPKQDELNRTEEQISALQQEIITKSQVWDDYTKLTKRNELNSLKMNYNSMLQTLEIEKAKIMKDLNKKNEEILKPLEEKLNAIMQDVGKKGGYCLVLDVSPPASNMPNFSNIIFFDVSHDITAEIIAEVDKK